VHSRGVVEKGNDSIKEELTVVVAMRLICKMTSVIGGRLEDVLPPIPSKLK